MVIALPVVITSTDGLRFHAQLFLPPAPSPAMRVPLRIFMHGGSAPQMLLGWNYSSY